MVKHSYLFLVLIILSVFFISCKEEDPVAPVVEPGNSKIMGKVLFLDENPAEYAVIELKSLLYGTVILDTCDAAGNFLFTGVSKGEYYLTFKSTGTDLNSSSVKAVVDTDEQEVTQNVTITYKQLDEFNARSMSPDVFFLKLQPHGARIGARYDKVDYFSGFYRNDYLKQMTLTCEVYKLPDHVSWLTPITVDSIRANFEFLMEIFEEPMSGNTHEIRIKDSAIPILLSDPSNGFAFVKKYADDKELQIPCLDFRNLDWGFVIKYK